jgi:hypothetical protein
MIHPVHEQPPVRQTRQRIVECEVFDLLVGALALRDITQVNGQPFLRVLRPYSEPRRQGSVVVLDFGHAVLFQGVMVCLINTGTDQIRV